MIFFSHAATDRARAQQVVAELGERGFDDVFLSSDPARGINAGDAWQSALYRRLRRAGAVVFLETTASVGSQWCFAELAIARALDIPILALTLSPLEERHPLTTDRQAVVGDAPGAVEHVCAWLAARVESGRAWPEGDCPFPGLASFGAEHEPVFLGRADAVADLLEIFAPLRTPSGARRIVVVSGPSGSGKSSLLYAGVLPALARRGYGVGPALTPGPDPCARLRDTVGEVPPGVLVVDQAEELLTLSAERERRQFLERIDALLREHEVWLLLGIRAEFVARERPNDLTTFLGESFASHLLLPMRLDRGQLQKVVVVPAERAGARVEPALVDRLVEDVGGEGAALPLLSFTLQEAWGRMRERLGAGTDNLELTLADYERTGGVGRAVARQARQARDRLALGRCGTDVLPTLARFAVPGAPGQRPTRRRVDARALTECAGQVVSEFEAQRLLRRVDDAYEVTHEAVFDAWHDLRDYVAEHAEMLVDRAEALRRARQWVQSGRSESDLLGGPRLERLAANPETDPELEDYVQASLAASRESRLAVLGGELEQTAEKVMALLRSEPQEAVALLRAAGARLRSESMDAPARLQGALYETVCAARERRREFAHDSAVLALAAAGGLVASGGADRLIRLWPGRRTLAGHDAAVRALAFSTDGMMLVSGADDGRVIAWRAAEGTVEVQRELPAPVTSIAVGGRRVAVGDEAGTIHVLRMPDLEVVVAHAAEIGFITACGFLGGETQVIACGADGTVRSLSDESEAAGATVEAHDGPILALAVTPGGDAFATGGFDGRVRIQGPSLELRAEAAAPGGLVAALAFTPDGRQLFSAGGDGTLATWDLELRRWEPLLIGHHGTATALVSAPDAVVSAGADTTVRWWQRDGRLLAVADPLRDPVNAVLFASEDLVLATTDERIHAYTADLRSLTIWPGHGDYIWALASSPCGERIASASADGTIRIWTSGGELVATLEGHDDDVTNVAFSAGGERLASGGMDGTVRLWSLDGRAPDVRAGDPLAQVNVVAWVGPNVVAGSNDGLLRLWGPDGDQLACVRTGEGPVRYAAVAAGGERIVTADERGDLRAWRLPDLSDDGRVRAHDGRVAMVVSAAPGGFHSSGADGTIRRWTTALEPVGEPLLAHDGGAWAIATSPLGDGIVSGGADGRLRAWRAGSWRAWLRALDARAQR